MAMGLCSYMTQGVTSRFQVTGMIEGFWGGGGLKFSTLGIFWVGKFLQLYLCSGNFCGLEIRHRIVLGLNFGPGIFLGFDFCPNSIIPVT